MGKENISSCLLDNAQEVAGRLYSDARDDKERLYIVELPCSEKINDKGSITLAKNCFTGNLYFVDLNRYFESVYLTEKDIKDFDERYWAFANEIGNE